MQTPGAYLQLHGFVFSFPLIVLLLAGAPTETFRLALLERLRQLLKLDQHVRLVRFHLTLFLVQPLSEVSQSLHSTPIAESVHTQAG